MLLQTCRHNFFDKVKLHMGAVKDHTWEELVEQAEIAEQADKKFEPSVPEHKWGVNTNGRDATQPSHSKGKEIMVVKLSGVTQLKQKSGTNNNQEFKFPTKAYSFKDEQGDSLPLTL